MPFLIFSYPAGKNVTISFIFSLLIYW